MTPARKNIKKKNRYLRLLVFTAVLGFAVVGVFAQTAGDYRTRTSGNWNASTTWQIYNGATWINASNYPGQASGAGVVTLLDNVILNVSPANSITSLVLQANLTQSNTNNNRSLSVSGEVLLSSGTLNLSSRNNYRITLSVGGDLTITGGTITETANTYGELIFNGSGNQVFTKTSGTISNNINFSVNSGSNLIMGTSILDGSAGSFVLNSGATLTTAHNDGITASGASGSIQVSGTRTFSTGASYVYNGTTAQTTGSGLPATVNNFTVDNPEGVSLTGSVSVSTTLTMTQGSITTGANLLTLLGSAAGSLSHAGTGAVIGRIRRVISTTTGENYLFPVGTATNYRPATMNFSSISATTNITAEFISTPPDGFVPYTDGATTLNNTFTEGYWRFSSSSTPTVSYSLTLTGDGFISFPLDAFTRITGRDNGNSTWRAMGTHGTVSGNNVSRTGVTTRNTTSFDFALATCYTPVFLGYGYERNITIDYTRVSGGSDLYNFPVMISLTGQDFLRNTPSGQIFSSSGYDIMFTDENYNELDHQLEYYNGTNGDLIAWVRIPTLSSSTNTVIKVLYGNPQATTDHSVTTVWDSHYKGVWHLDNNNLNDFTSYNVAGTPFNSPTYPAGMISNSLGLNGSNQYVQVTNDPAINFAGNITVSAWVYMAAGSRDQKIAGNQNNSSGGYKFGIYTNNMVEFEIRNSANIASLNRGVSGGTVLSTGQWYYLAGISSDVLDSIKTFVNGVSERPFKKTGTLGVASNNLVVGREPFDPLNYFFSGRFDELRISDKVRSDGWMRTEYYNQSSPSTFYTVDATGVTADYLPAESLCGGPITLSFGYPAGGTYSGNPYISGDVFEPPTPGTYSITYTYIGGCGATSITRDIIITGHPPAPAAPDKEYCSSQIALLEATSGVNIRWYSGSTLVSTANPYSTGQTTPGTYNYTVTQTVNGCESTATPVTLTIYNGITINTQPTAASICSGSNASFSVEASGYNLTYRWQENGVNISDDGVYSGATTPTLTLTSPGTAMNGSSYRCVITSSCGPSTATSSSAMLTISPLLVATFSYAGTPYCPNAANPLPTFSGGGVAGSFTSTPGLVFVSAATGQINIAASTPGTYTVTNTIPPIGVCGEVVATSPVEIISTITWTGLAGSDWNNTGSWSCGFVPTQLMSVLIPDVANDPVINTGVTGEAINLVLAGGSSLTVNGGTLRIAGSVSNSGTLDATSGTVVFNGTSVQSIAANTFSANTVGNLTVNNPAGVTLLGQLNVGGVVHLQNGSLASDGYLTLLSTASQTALIDGSGTGNVTGSVTMQRYLPSKYGYKYFSSPFQAATVGEFGDDMDLAYVFPLFYRNEENSRGSGWTDYTDPDNILNPLEGYAVNFGASATPWTVDVAGEVNNGPLSVTLYNHDSTYTKGFNLVGNPYPSPIDWDAAGWTKTEIDNAIYYFKASDTDEYGGEYSSYAGGVSSDGGSATNVIPSMQGFFVHVTDGSFPVTGTLGITNNVRINDLNHPFLKSAVTSSRFLVRATATFTGDNASADPLVVYFRDEAGISFDSEFDALKLMNTDMMVTNFYSLLNGGKKLSINALPVQTDTALIVPLGLKTYIDGELNFKIKDLENLPEGTKIYFRDLVTGANLNLLPDKTYKVTLNAGDYNDRFFLAFLKSATDITDPEASEALFTVYATKTVLKVTINHVENRMGTVTLFDLIGRPLFITGVFEPGYYEFDTGIKEGIYIVRYITGNKKGTTKLFIGY